MIVDAVSGLLLVAGGLFCVTGAVGLVRFPDLYTRLHAVGVGDTLGAFLVLGGLFVLAAGGEHGFVTAALHGEGLAGMEHGLIVGFKLISTLFFMWVSGTTACHALAKAAHLSGLEPWQAPADAPTEGDTP